MVRGRRIIIMMHVYGQKYFILQTHGLCDVPMCLCVCVCLYVHVCVYIGYCRAKFVMCGYGCVWVSDHIRVYIVCVYVWGTVNTTI